MHIEVRFRSLEASEALRDHAIKQVAKALRRFGSVVRAAVVRLSDVNGPKGGLDKRCQIELVGPLATVEIEDIGADPYASIQRASERAVHAFTRRHQRGKDRARQRRAYGRRAARSAAIDPSLNQT